MFLLKPSIKAAFLFLLFAIFWGASFPVAQSALKFMGPYYFVFLRFVLAAALIFPFVFQRVNNMRALLLAGVILGILNTGIYGFEILSLQHTSSARCSFITGTSVILVPFLACLFQRANIAWLDVLAAIVCCIGIYILTDAHFNHINLGDLYALIGAISIAISLNCVQLFSDRHFNPQCLTFFQLFFTCPIPLTLSIVTTSVMWFSSWQAWWPVIFCAVLATALPLLGQMKWQKHLSATQAALLFAMEPVFTAITAHFFYHEIIPAQTLVGGGIILMGVLIATLLRELVH